MLVESNRRDFLLSLVASAALFALRDLAEARNSNISVGAIRWDPWYIGSDTGARVDMERTLGPARWQRRAPSCAKATANDSLDLGGCGIQSRLDMELLAASAANLDYWAYVWYAAQNTMQAAWRLHQSSRFGARVSWCKIYSSYSIFAEELANSLEECIGHLSQSNYHQVNKSRPLVFLLPDESPARDVAASIQMLRGRCLDRRVGDPYVVLLSGAQTGSVAAVGADAIGIYSKAWSAPVAGSYSDLTFAVQHYWDNLAETRQAIVPTAVTGADRRPRIERPVPWEAKYQKPGIGDDHFYFEGTPLQIAHHVSRMIRWIRANPKACPAQTGLIYSWDEHDEGGSTLNPTVGNGSAVLDAVGISLREARSGRFQQP